MFTLYTGDGRAAAGGVLMLSRDQEYDVTAGSEVELECEFHMDHYRMFDNPTFSTGSRGHKVTTWVTSTALYWVSGSVGHCHSLG